MKGARWPGHSEAGCGMRGLRGKVLSYTYLLEAVPAVSLLHAYGPYTHLLVVLLYTEQRHVQARARVRVAFLVAEVIGRPPRDFTAFQSL